MKRDYLNRILFEEADDKPDGGGSGSGDKKVDDKKGDKSDDSSDDDQDDDDEDDSTPEERTNAIKLFRALNDPNASKSIIRALAENAGLLDGDSKGSKKDKNEFIETLAQHLGKDYDWLAEKLGPAVEKMFKSQEEKLDKRFRERASQDLAAETDTAIDFMLKEHKDFKLHSKKIQSLMKEFTPAEGQSQKKYLERLYQLAKVEAGERLDDKRAKNRNDVTSRLTSLGGKDEKNKKSEDRPTRRQSIEKAFQDLEGAQDDKD